MTTTKTKDSYEVKGSDVVGKVKKLIEEGNLRRLTISDKSGKVLLDIPLSIGILGAIIAPVLALVGGIAAMITECTITVEKK